MSRLFTLLMIVCIASACGDDASDNNDNSNNANNANNSNNANNENNANNTTDLTCASHALCTTHEVRHFPVESVDATGGTLIDGVYTLSWVEEDPADFDEDSGSDVDVIVIQGNQYLWEGTLGTISTSGSSLTLVGSETCETGNSLGSSSVDYTLPYTISGDELRLYDEQGGGKFLRLVYVWDGGASACEQFTRPSEPGPSHFCEVSNCGCIARVGSAISNQECDF